VKKKIFLVVPSLKPGGSERVFWLLSQYFNNEKYAVSVVVINASGQCYSTNVKGVSFIDLKTIKASRSFFKLYNLLKAEKPYAVFSTADHVNILTAMVCCFLKVPNLIARGSNNPEEMKKFHDKKSNVYNYLNRFLFTRFNFIVCQSNEMQQSISKLYGVHLDKLRVIPNPVLNTSIIKERSTAGQKKRLIIVARLSVEKGLFRLLDIIQELSENYVLTIVGVGPLMDALIAEVELRKLGNRVAFLGQINDVQAQIAKHDVMVLSSFTEGFPNVVLEALSVGVPVVSFQVNGINDMIREGFNGYVANQHDIIQFKELIIQACSQSWPHEEIKTEVYKKFALDKIGQVYEGLLRS
jgi:glycosyltransferase involved in cell wall biosynthesis